MKYIKKYYIDFFLRSNIFLTVNETPPHTVVLMFGSFNAVFSVIQNAAEIKFLPDKELKSE